MTNLLWRSFCFCCGFSSAKTVNEKETDIIPPPPPPITQTPTPSIKKFRKRLSSSRGETVPIVDKKKWRILVVDDSAVCRKSTARILKLHQHYVDEADDGVECIFMVQLAADYNNEPYDALICDDDMPNMMGHEATKLLRAKGFDDLRIVGLTGNKDDNNLQHFRDCGADIVIRKPMTEALWLRIYNSLIKEETMT